MVFDPQSREAKPMLLVAQAEAPTGASARANGRSSVEYKDYWNIKGLKDERDIIDWSADFIVFFNSDIDREIDWDTSLLYDDNIQKDAKRLAAQNAILADAAILEAKDCTPFGTAARDWFRYLLGKAYVFTFQGDFEGA
jgi:hypothetical protein